MNGMKKWTAVIMSALILASMAACTETADTSGNLSNTSSVVSSTPESTSSSVSRESSVAPESSQPESAASEASEEPSKVADPASATGEKLESLSVGSADFQALFLQNPIDEKFSTEFDNATSTSLLGDIIYDATESWRQMVSIAYDAALESSGTDERRKEVQDAYNTFLNTMQAGLTEAETLSASDPVAGALATMNHYRTCAAELCNLKYENDQALPSFDLSAANGAAG